VYAIAINQILSSRDAAGGQDFITSGGQQQAANEERIGVVIDTQNH